MRCRLATIVVMLLLSMYAAAQQSEQKKAAGTKDEPKSAAVPQKPAEKQPETVLVDASKPAAGKDSEEGHFDMTEVAPVVTRHQITVNGKPLKYTATAGRLPIIGR